MNSDTQTLKSTSTSTLWSLTRQTHFVAAIFVWTGLILALKVSLWGLVLVGLPGFGLLLDAVTGICPMTLLLQKMPWNR